IIRNHISKFSVKQPSHLRDFVNIKDHFHKINGLNDCWISFRNTGPYLHATTLSPYVMHEQHSFSSLTYPPGMVSNSWQQTSRNTRYQSCKFNVGYIGLCNEAIDMPFVYPSIVYTITNRFGKSLSQESIYSFFYVCSILTDDYKTLL
ncbi:hypothetical protein GJ496_007034, partial [Pomphorhynchus laevis]